MKTKAAPTLSLRRINISVCLSLLCVATLRAGVEIKDDFTDFNLGQRWRPHGAGAPDVALAVVGVGADGGSLRMGASAGKDGEVVGIESNPLPMAGVRSIKVTARLRPLNQTAAGDGGASDASAGVAIVGASGAFVRASAGANRASAPDWGDFYVDSKGGAVRCNAFLDQKYRL